MRYIRYPDVDRAMARAALQRWYDSQQAPYVLRIDQLLDNVARYYFARLLRRSLDNHTDQERAFTCLALIFDHFDRYKSIALQDFIFDFICRVDALYVDLAQRLELYQMVDRLANEAFRAKYNREPSAENFDVSSTYPYYLNPSVLYDSATDVAYIMREAEHFKWATSELRASFERNMFIVPLQAEELEAFKQIVLDDFR